MFALAKAAAVLVIIALLGTPAMACLVPGMSMTTEEHECCRHMARQCGEMQMPASHSCCRTELPTANAYVPATSAGLPTVAICQSAAPVTLSPICAPKLWWASIHIEHPPPEFTIHTTILRI